MRLFRFKRGVSPLIATVLLIALAVSLGAVVMNWGRGYVETTASNAQAQSASKISCSMDTSIGVVQVGNKMKLCVLNNTDGTYNLSYTFTNTGSVDLEGVQVTEIYNNSAPVVHTALASSPVTASGLYYGSTALGFTDGGTPTYSDLEEVEVAPVILVNGVNTVCPEHSITKLTTELPMC
jgi:flagellin-like protein